jgi:ribonuclease-3
MQADRQKNLQALATRLGYEFSDLNLLDQALKHSSYVHENRGAHIDCNERLEFLGDAVLELCISQMLYERFPQADEGAMSKARSSLVNETRLAEAARELGLGQFMMLGRGEDIQQGREKPSLLSDAVEASLAAVYLDGGLDQVKLVVSRLFGGKLERAMLRASRKDYKTRIQEKVQEQLHITPRYRLVEAVGPDHEKSFKVMLMISGKEVAMGSGRSKKEAEQQAAQEGLELIKQGLELE